MRRARGNVPVVDNTENVAGRTRLSIPADPDYPATVVEVIARYFPAGGQRQ